MGITPFIMAGIAAAGVANSISSGQKQAKLAKETAAQNQANADRQLKLQEMDFNKLNAKTPSYDAALSKAMLEAKNGNSGTMLTGNMGVTSTGTLGRTSLLGG